LVEVDLQRLADNYHAIRSHVSPAKVMPILKANAYGHGLLRVAELMESLGAEYLGVAVLEEGILLRENGIGAPRIGAISGPSFAKEVARGDPTAITVASSDSELAEVVQREFSEPSFRVYTNDDVAGVELGGALKNVVAIAAGICDGLGLGHNSVAALITRGLTEITRLAVACGARADTMAGLAGIGDLVLTCTGGLSRNRTVGVELGKGRKLADIIAGMHGMVAEGVLTTNAAVGLARKFRVEMPITEQIYDILNNGKSPRNAIHELMTRPGTSEVALHRA
jgi:glycerol-3-phosphate dehydrogenase (NAD(P)+)